MDLDRARSTGSPVDPIDPRHGHLGISSRCRQRGARPSGTWLIRSAEARAAEVHWLCGQAGLQRLLRPDTHTARRRVKTMMRIKARRCIPLRVGASLSEDLRLDRLSRAPAPCVSGSSRNFRGYESASTWITLSFMDQTYAAGLCRARNSAARARPQRRQRQRRVAWSTLRFSGVSKWPLPQMAGMATGSRTRSGEKDTT